MPVSRGPGTFAELLTQAATDDEGGRGPCLTSLPSSCFLGLSRSAWVQTVRLIVIRCRAHSFRSGLRGREGEGHWVCSRKAELQ